MTDQNQNEYIYNSVDDYGIFITKSDGNPYTQNDIISDTPLYVDCDYLAYGLKESLLTTMNGYFNQYGYEVFSDYDNETGDLNYIFTTTECINFKVFVDIKVKGSYECA
jgi:hypothetical protein